MISFFKKLFGKSHRHDSEAGHSSIRGFESSFHGGPEITNHAQLVQVVMRELIRKSGIPPGWIVCYPQVLNSRSRGRGIFVRLSVKHWDDRLMKHAFAFQKTLLHDLVRLEPKAATWLHGIAWQLEVASTCPHTVLPERDFWLEAPALVLNPLPSSRSAPAARPTLVTPIVPGPAVVIAAATAATVATVGVAMPDASKAAPLQIKPAVVDTEAPASKDDAIEDLLRLFAVRDKELADHGALEVSRTLPEIAQNGPVHNPSYRSSENASSQAYERTQPARLAPN